MIYQWRAGARFPVDPKEAAQQLTALRRRKGKLAPSDVVAASRAKTAPLHKCFEWDDAVAAEEHRRQTARTLIGALVMVDDDATDTTEPIRCFVSVDREDDESDYTPLQVLLKEMTQDPATREQMLARAIRDIQGFRRAYAHLLPELGSIFEAIENLTRASV